MRASVFVVRRSRGFRRLHIRCFCFSRGVTFDANLWPDCGRNTLSQRDCRERQMYTYRDDCLER